MSISNYTELQAKIAAWMVRGDLGDTIPSFIALAEAKLNRNTNISARETVVDEALTGNEHEFPSGMTDLLGMQAVNSGNVSPMTKVPYGSLRISSNIGVPVYYAVADKFYFDCDATGTAARIHYRKKLDIAADETNWLLTNYPDIYLFGSLVEASAFAKQSVQVITGWAQRLNDALNELNHGEAKKKQTSLRADIPMSASSAFDIKRGY